MRKIVNLLFFILLLGVHLLAQNTESNEASILFTEGKYSAAQTLYQQIIRNNASDETAHYHNARCSKELFASGASPITAGLCILIGLLGRKFIRKYMNATFLACLWLSKTEKQEVIT